jgi:hypothetical protein
MLLIDAYMTLKLYGKAYKIADGIRKVDPENGLAVAQAAIAALRADPAKGLPRVEAAIKSNELSDPVQTKVLVAMLAAEQHEKLVELVDHAIADNRENQGGNYPIAWEMVKAEAMGKLGQAEAAIARLEGIRASIPSTEAKIQLQQIIDKIKAGQSE